MQKGDVNEISKDNEFQIPLEEANAEDRPKRVNNGNKDAK